MMKNNGGRPSNDSRVQIDGLLFFIPHPSSCILCFHGFRLDGDSIRAAAHRQRTEDEKEFLVGSGRGQDVLAMIVLDCEANRPARGKRLSPSPGRFPAQEGGEENASEEKPTARPSLPCVHAAVSPDWREVAISLTVNKGIPPFKSVSFVWLLRRTPNARPESLFSVSFGLRAYPDEPICKPRSPLPPPPRPLPGREG